MTEGQKRKAKVTKIRNQTIRYMQAVGTFKEEFDASVQRYSDMRVQYDILTEKWYETGCVITEEYTNKAGVTNQRKTTLYLSSREPEKGTDGHGRPVRPHPQRAAGDPKQRAGRKERERPGPAAGIENDSV